MVELAGNKMER